MITRNIKTCRLIITVSLVILCAVLFATGAMAQDALAKADSLPSKQLSPAETRLQLTGLLPRVDSIYKSLLDKYHSTPKSELPKIEFESEHLNDAAVSAFQQARLVNNVSGSDELKQAVLIWTNSLSDFTYTIRIPLGDDDKENFQRYQVRKKEIEDSVIELTRQRQLVVIAEAAYVKRNNL